MTVSTFEIPATQPGDEGWENYQTSILINATTAESLKPGTDSPEAALTHFYASLIRGDDDYKVAIPEPASPRLTRKLEELQSWRLLKIELLGRLKEGDDRCFIKLFMEIEHAGKVQQGHNEAALGLRDGCWLVANPPT